jgi:hypothetical protein
MDSKWHLAYWLAIVWFYFVGRIRGMRIEAKDWFTGAIKGCPVIKEGYIFEVKDITGGDE